MRVAPWLGQKTASQISTSLLQLPILEERQRTTMKVAPNVIFLFKDIDGFATAFADALHPNPNSSLRRLEEGPFELSLDRYGIKDRKARGNLVHFVDTNGNYQVSVLLVETCVPPTLLCAVNEILTQIIGEASSSLPTITVPFLATPSKLKWDGNSLTVDGTEFLELCSLHIGSETDISRAIASRTQKLPSALQIHYEPLACFLQLVRILKLPTSFLVGKSSSSLSDKASGEDLEILCKMGKLLANTADLSFARERITWNPSKTTRDSEEPWRALYG